MSPEIYAVILVVFLGSLIQSLTGFGFALVAAPLLSLFLEPKVFVPIIALLAMGLVLVLFVESRFPQEHLAPFLSTTICPISPADSLAPR